MLNAVLFGQTLNLDQTDMKLNIILDDSIWLTSCMNNIGERIRKLENILEHEEQTMDSSHNAPTKCVLLTECQWYSHA